MPKKKEDPVQAPPPGDNVDQIRELLFGTHIRAVDERFDVVEERLARESDSLRKKLERRIRELEKLVDKFRKDTSVQFGREAAEREAGLGAVNESLAAFRLDTKKQLAELQSEFSAEIKQVRRDLEAAQMTLMGELGALQLAQTNRSDRLDADKVDRRELSGFLSDIAGRLVPSTSKRSK